MARKMRCFEKSRASGDRESFLEEIAARMTYGGLQNVLKSSFTSVMCVICRCPLFLAKLMGRDNRKKALRRENATLSLLLPTCRVPFA